MISSCVINQFLIDLLNRICRINWTGAQSNGSNDTNNVIYAINIIARIKCN